MNFPFSVFLVFYCKFFFIWVSFNCKKKKKRSRIVSLLSCVCLVLVAGVHVPVGLNCDQMEPPYEEQHSQYPVERNPNAYRSMRDYRNPPRMSAPSCIVPSTNAPYGNAYNPSWGNHLNLSWGPKPLQYAPSAHSHYASSSQPQPPQSTSLVEQAILNLSKLVGDFVEKKKAINAQLSQKIDTVENNVDKRIDGLQSEIDQKFDNLHKSISRLANQQNVHQEEENLEEECLIDTTVDEHCKQQNEAISPLLTEEGSGQEAVEEPQKPNLKPLPTKLDHSATAQATNSPPPVAPFSDQVHILPKLAAHETHGTPTGKVIPSALHVQYFRKLVASVQTFATTSKTLTTAHVAWHNGWLILIGAQKVLF